MLISKASRAKATAVIFVVLLMTSVVVKLISARAGNYFFAKVVSIFAYK